jgi:hypothetical protein
MPRGDFLKASADPNKILDRMLIEMKRVSRLCITRRQLDIIAGMYQYEALLRNTFTYPEKEEDPAPLVIPQEVDDLFLAARSIPRTSTNELNEQEWSTPIPPAPPIKQR